MKRSLFGIAAIAALVATPAFAADIPLKALPPAVPLFLWTGWYGGANVGYSWGSSLATTNIQPGTTTAEIDSRGIPHRGWEASVEGGYCYQQSPTTNFVACLEARYDFPAERSPPTIVPTTPTTTTPPTVTSTTRVDPFLIGPHLGFTTGANRTLWYAAGGLAIGEVGGSSTGTSTLGTSTADPSDKWAAGWFVGAGVEQMLNNNWSLKVEYDYVHLDTGGVTGPYAGTDPTLNPTTCPIRVVCNLSTATATLASRPYDNVVTVGINYHLH
jgi:outer membrane immunogenic protein